MNRRRMGLFLLPLLGSVASAQVAPRVPTEKPKPTATLSLGEALAKARAQSPAYRQILNDVGPAGVAVRNAWGQFVPTVDVGGNLGYVGSGKPTFGGETFNQFSPSYTSGYGLQLGLNVSGQTMPLRREEVTIAQAAKSAGYVTGHFGKWHLNGVAGPGKPIEAADPLGPGSFGFDEWFSVSNWFDLDWTFSRKGEKVKVAGDGSLL